MMYDWSERAKRITDASKALAEHVHRVFGPFARFLVTEGRKGNGLSVPYTYTTLAFVWLVDRNSVGVLEDTKVTGVAKRDDAIVPRGVKGWLADTLIDVIKSWPSPESLPTEPDRETLAILLDQLEERSGGIVGHAEGNITGVIGNQQDGSRARMMNRIGYTNGEAVRVDRNDFYGRDRRQPTELAADGNPHGSKKL